MTAGWTSGEVELQLAAHAALRAPPTDAEWDIRMAHFNSPLSQCWRWFTTAVLTLAACVTGAWCWLATTKYDTTEMLVSASLTLALLYFAHRVHRLPVRYPNEEYNPC